MKSLSKYSMFAATLLATIPRVEKYFTSIKIIPAKGKRVAVRATPKIGRNELCPCGSGKKYKHCYLKGLHETI